MYKKLINIWRRRTTAFKYAFYSWIAMSIFMSVVTLFSYNNFMHYNRKAQTNIYKDKAKSDGGRIKQFFNGYEYYINAFACSEYVKDATKKIDNKESWDKAEEYTKNYAKGRDDVEGVFYINSDGVQRFIQMKNKEIKKT